MQALSSFSHTQQHLLNSLIRTRWLEEKIYEKNNNVGPPSFLFRCNMKKHVTQMLSSVVAQTDQLSPVIDPYAQFNNNKNSIIKYYQVNLFHYVHFVQAVISRLELFSFKVTSIKRIPVKGQDDFLLPE